MGNKLFKSSKNGDSLKTKVPKETNGTSKLPNGVDQVTETLANVTLAPTTEANSCKCAPPCKCDPCKCAGDQVAPDTPAQPEAESKVEGDASSPPQTETSPVDVPATEEVPVIAVCPAFIPKEEEDVKSDDKPEQEPEEKDQVVEKEEEKVEEPASNDDATPEVESPSDVVSSDN